jgi:hypothetical protein
MRRSAHLPHGLMFLIQSTPPGLKQNRWEPGSFGYHGDDGLRYAASGKGEEYGPRFGAGDTIGAAVHLGRHEIFFT